MAKETKVPDDLRYTKDHEWVRMEGDVATVGITDYAQEALTDVVFVELPEVGEEFQAHDSLGVVESTKSVSDVFAPLSGQVVEVNTLLEERPELVNLDPYGSGWMVRMRIRDPKEAVSLLDAQAYRRFLSET